ncbi:hypothetical protein ARMGADRAFT_1020474 [Armillaria gallica]|uniref:Uncharacterized protein n=1 Tax=Armillaria gallica TaxID=47427 RepID=A0A2H3CDU8_ARMGA|nr:hypothetical protein ARMGADRAFT_1020474 [Armillaria gallica]
MALRAPTTLPTNRLSLESFIAEGFLLLQMKKLRWQSRQYEFSVRDDDGRHTLKTSATHCMPVTRSWHSPNVTAPFTDFR